MTQTLPDYLADLYRLEELEGWQLLARHLELVERFSFLVILAPDDLAIAYLRSQLPRLVGPDPEAVHRVAFDPKAGIGSLAESLLYMPELPETTRLIWVDADPCDPADIPARDEAWRKALSRLNRYRNTLQARFKCTLVFAGPFSLQVFVREEAPDLWSIRSTVIRFEPVGSAQMQNGFIRRLPPERDDYDDMGLGGDPTETLVEADKIRGKLGRELLLAQLLHRAGRQAFRQLKWDLAIRCLQEASELEETYGGDPELRFQLANDIASVFREIAQWDRALHFARKALEIAGQYFGSKHPYTGVALLSVAQRRSSMLPPRIGYGVSGL